MQGKEGTEFRKIARPWDSSEALPAFLCLGIWFGGCDFLSHCERPENGFALEFLFLLCQMLKKVPTIRKTNTEEPLHGLAEEQKEGVLRPDRPLFPGPCFCGSFPSALVTGTILSHRSPPHPHSPSSPRPEEISPISHHQSS